MKNDSKAVIGLLQTGWRELEQVSEGLYTGRAQLSAIQDKYQSLANTIEKGEQMADWNVFVQVDGCVRQIAICRAWLLDRGELFFPPLESPQSAPTILNIVVDTAKPTIKGKKLLQNFAELVFRVQEDFSELYSSILHDCETFQASGRDLSELETETENRAIHEQDLKQPELGKRFLQQKCDEIGNDLETLTDRVCHVERDYRSYKQHKSRINTVNAASGIQTADRMEPELELLILKVGAEHKRLYTEVRSRKEDIQGFSKWLEGMGDFPEHFTYRYHEEFVLGAV